MGNLLINRQFWLVLALLGLGAGLSRPGFAAVTCKVTATGDISGVPMTPGTFRDMLYKANNGQCIGQKIIFQVPKVTMNAPLGAGVLAGLNGLVIEPAPGIAEAEIVVKYSNPEFVASCSGPSVFKECFAYLPISDVILRRIRVSVDPTTVSIPLYGLCIDKDLNAAGITNNNILIENSRFEGFSQGGVNVSSSAYGIEVRQTTFKASGAGIVLASDAQGPLAPVMGGSPEALFAQLDEEGAVSAYHLRGVSNLVKTEVDRVELFEADGAAGGKYLQDCDLHFETPTDGKWNIECILPTTTPLPFHYAVTITHASKGTSMFSTGTIPVDVAQLPTVQPLPPQTPVVPSTNEIGPNLSVCEETNCQEVTPASGDVSKPLSLNVTPFEGAGGCSLIR